MKQYDSLDSLRGLAILFVVISHLCTNAYIFNLTDYPILGEYNYSFSFFGDLGVLLFFYLSGFLIYKSLENTSFKIFLMKRILRIIPPYWFSIFIVFIVSQLFSFIPNYNLSDYIKNIFMLQDFFRSISLNGVYWSLLIEIKFYIFIAIIFYILIEFRNKILYTYFFIILLGSIVYIYKDYSPSALLTWFPSFFIGVFIYQYFNSKISLKILYLTIIVYFIYSIIMKDYFFGMHILVNFILFFFFFKYNLSNKVLMFFGNISYSLYLLHTTISYPLLYIMTKYISNDFAIIKILIVFTLSISISYFSYKNIETLYSKYRKQKT